MTFGHKLKRYREEHGMTQQDLAELVGTQKQTIWRFENNDITPRKETAKLYAEKLGLPLVYLLYENIVTESGLDLTNESVRSALSWYVDADENGTPTLSFKGLCDSENVNGAYEIEKRENQEYKAFCEELRERPLGRDEVNIIIQLRRQPEFRVAVMRILGIEK